MHAIYCEYQRLENKASHFLWKITVGSKNFARTNWMTRKSMIEEADRIKNAPTQSNSKNMIWMS